MTADAIQAGAAYAGSMGRLGPPKGPWNAVLAGSKATAALQWEVHASLVLLICMAEWRAGL